MRALGPEGKPFFFEKKKQKTFANIDRRESVSRQTQRVRTLSNGGANGCGTIFEIDPATGAFTSIYRCQGGPDGANPGPVLVAGPGVLYGNATAPSSTTCNGPCGTIFAYTP